LIQEFEIATDDRQQIFEVVRDTPRDLADLFQVLSLSQRLLPLL
jgi:hypothetical protein